MKKNLDTEENREFWNSVDKTIKEVEKWPEEKKFSVVIDKDDEDFDPLMRAF